MSKVLIMRFPSVPTRYFPLLLLAVPGVASAQTLSQAVGLFNVFVGLMLVGALLTYGIGFVVWLVRLGTWPTYRTEAIKIMEWSVVILFVLVVILGIVQFIEKHPRAASYLVGTVLVLLIIWAIVYLAANAKGKKKEDEE